jgi:hypothetical protein
MPWTVDHGPRSGGNWKNGKDCDQVSNAQGVSLDFSGKLIFGAGTRRLALDGEIGHARRVNAPPDSP